MGLSEGRELDDLVRSRAKAKNDRQTDVSSSILIRFQNFLEIIEAECDGNQRHGWKKVIMSTCGSYVEIS
jgi:hypothetical protein